MVEPKDFQWDREEYGSKHCRGGVEQGWWISQI